MRRHQGSSSSTLSGGFDPLGVNTAAWDTNFLDPSVPKAMSQADVGLVRYPGGSYADEYMWQANTEGGTTDPVDFAQYSSQVDAAGGQKFVTVNYGSDTATDAAAWVTQSETSGQGVSLWEIGNEQSGTWETDNRPDPYTASSYATDALPYMQDMKAVDPNAQICYDYGHGRQPGARLGSNWLPDMERHGAFRRRCGHKLRRRPLVPVQRHGYRQQPGNPRDRRQHPRRGRRDPHPRCRPTTRAHITWSARRTCPMQRPLGTMSPSAPCSRQRTRCNGCLSVPRASWTGACSDYGTESGDIGMFSSGNSGEPAEGTPQPPYYGYELAAQLAVKGATVGTLSVPEASVYGWYSNLPSGGRAVMLVNADPRTPPP